MIRSTLTDTDILHRTEQFDQDEKGRVRLRFTLPSGRTVTSHDRLVPSEIKGKVLIAWADAMRREDEADQMEVERQEQEAIAAKEARGKSSDAPSETGAPAKSDASELGNMLSSEEPEKLVLSRIRNLREYLLSLEDSLHDTEQKISTTNKTLKQWEAIAVGLGIEEDEGLPDDDYV